ncbi:hypothetical protein [Planctomicrobium sp. SH527]|uniref:hypothetical protein n=1 Tax=Planctomicrobium sp. SH527 TaxID=3448123 RepID=UPI003F5AE441
MQKYRGHDALWEEVCYSLPRELIQAIQKHAPQFLSREELAFEESLAQLPASGLFLGQLFSYPPLRHLHPLPSDEISQRHQQTSAQIQTLLEETMLSEGRSRLQIARYHQQKLELQEKLNLRAQGFVGWLVTHSPYQERCRELQTRWSSTVTPQNGFPQLPKSTFGVCLNPNGAEQQERFSDFMQFYREWNLEGMVTWELPIPLSPAVATMSLNEIQALGPDVGVTLFIPWYLLIDKDLKVNQLVQQEVGLSSTHVKPWLDQRDHQKFGVARYSDMLQLFLYQELALKRRYGEDLRKSIGKLDEAFATFFQDKKLKNRGRIQAETVKRVRQRMAKRLNS